MINMTPYTRAWSSLPSVFKVAIVAALVVFALLLSVGVGGAIATWKDSRFDKAEAARAAERDALTLERDAWIKRAVQAEAAAAVLEEQAAALKQVASDAGQTAKEKAAKAEEIERATQTAVDAAGALAPDDARALARQKLKDLGLLR